MDMSRLSVSVQTLADYRRAWRGVSANRLPWECLFSLPPWVEAWWDSFGAGAPARILAVRDGEEVVGLAPLMETGGTLRVMGDPEVCDTLDLVTAPGRAAAIVGAMIDHLRAEGFAALAVGPVRDDAASVGALRRAAHERGLTFSVRPGGTTSLVVLPDDWERYLAGLAGKERHEIRRKERRLHRAGAVRWRRVTAVAPDRRPMDDFLRLLRESRPDKRRFMTPPMEAYFRRLADLTAAADLLRLFFIDLDGRPAAAVLCFDHQGTRYLYNNGYDPRHRDLSVGLLCKLFSMADAMGEGLKRYDFLKGSERYKRQLGGHPQPLVECRLGLT
jgi:CelD/BcsL family acetyltransferase involved in cellulose biosynthesis